MKTIELKNSFHNTSVRVRVPDSVAEAGQGEAWLYFQEPVSTGRATGAEKARLRRVRRALCGMSDCSCGVVR